jgi:E3 ubiquitin-protein ligase HUWE1
MNVSKALFNNAKRGDDEVAALLKDIDTRKWPRTDLNAWTKVLPFSESAKDLLSEILRFERLLLEYSTNRKMFSCYDRLNNLLSSNLEIVILALNVLLRPSQQYSS